jgi:hypothetical protein
MELLHKTKPQYEFYPTKHWDFKIVATQTPLLAAVVNLLDWNAKKNTDMHCCKKLSKLKKNIQMFSLFSRCFRLFAK